MNPNKCLDDELNLLGFIVFGLCWAFQIFYLNEQLGSLLVDLSHQLSFYLDSPVLLDYLKIRKFITYWSFVVFRSCEHKEIFNYF